MRTVTLLEVGFLAVLASACSRPTPTASNPAKPALAPPPAPSPAPTLALSPSPAPTPVPSPSTRHATAFRVDRLVIARGVEAREPLGADTVFAADEKRLFAFLEVDNPEHAPGDVRVEFVGPAGQTQPPIELSVGESPRWRTWAFTRNARAPGTWKAIVRDERGHVLASTEFDVRG